MQADTIPCRIGTVSLDGVGLKGKRAGLRRAEMERESLV